MFFLPLVKADQANRLVWARAAAEEADKSKEILDYLTAVPQFQKWSDGFSSATDGKSFGNIRAMHNPQHLAGVVKKLEFNDNDKAIDVCFKVLDPTDWHKLEEGGYTGLSIGGGYLKKWKDDADPALTRYTPRISEISLVDSPCIPSARIMELQKQDGTTEEILLKGVLPPTFAQLLPPPTFGELHKSGQWKGILAGATGAVIGAGLGAHLAGKSKKKQSSSGAATGAELGGTASEVTGAALGEKIGGLRGAIVGGAAGGLIGGAGGAFFGSKYGPTGKSNKPRRVPNSALKQDKDGDLEKITFPGKGRIGSVVGNVHRQVTPFLHGIKEGPIGQTFGHLQTGIGYMKTAKEVASIGGGAVGAIGGISALHHGRRRRKPRQDQGVVKPPSPALMRAELIDNLTKILTPATLGVAGSYAGGKIGSKIGRRIGELVLEGRSHPYHDAARFKRYGDVGEKIGRRTGYVTGALAGAHTGTAVEAVVGREHRRLQRKMKRTGQLYAAVGKQEPTDDLEKASLGSAEGREKIRQTLHEYKHGTLRSYRSNLPKKKMPHVTDRKQAIAIALSQARRMMDKSDDPTPGLKKIIVPLALGAAGALVGSRVAGRIATRRGYQIGTKRLLSGATDDFYAPERTAIGFGHAGQIGGGALAGAAGWKIGRRIEGSKSDTKLADAAAAGHAVAGPAGAAVAAVKQHKRSEHRIGKSEHVDFLTKFANPIKLLPAPAPQ